MVDADAAPAASAVSVAADVTATVCLAAAATASSADATDVDAEGAAGALVLWRLRLRPLLRLSTVAAAGDGCGGRAPVDGGFCAMMKKRVRSQGTAGIVLLAAGMRGVGDYSS